MVTDDVPESNAPVAATRAVKVSVWSPVAPSMARSPNVVIPELEDDFVVVPIKEPVPESLVTV